jgi:peptidyl-prolyl cis-trans isomerase D
MSVIQSIREKYAKWAVVAIALALLGFILTDYFQAQSRMGPGNSTTLGSVNGEKIDWINFETRLKSMNDQAQAQAQQQGREYTEEESHQNNERLWNQDVEQIVMASEFKKLGLDIGAKEFNDWLFGQNPPADLKQRFADQQGNYDAAAAQNAINQMKRSTNKADRDQLDSYLASLEYSRKLDKLNSLLSNSVYYPKWYVEKQNADAAGLAKVSYVSYPYSKIGDSTIKISDKEIEEYISKNKDQFKQEENRSIAYVVFDAAPTEADSAIARKQLSDLKAEFAASTEPARLLSRYGSAIPYYDGYVGKSQIQVPAKDSIFALAKDSVFGPYLDQNTYVLAKLIDSKPLPDSVKARHILIGTFDPQSGQQLLDDSTAKKRIDSIDAAIKGGAKFDSLAVKYSTDQSSAVKGGLLSNPQKPATNYYKIGTMVKEFNDFSFEKKTGAREVVKTAFGYHLIEILDQKNFQPHYKVAYLAKNILASEETEQTALEEASKFSSESQDLKTFEANIAKSKGRLEKMEAGNIKPNDITVQGLQLFGTSRSLVREIYKAKKGEVLKQERLGSTRTGYKYVDAIVTDILEEGTQPVYVARQMAERPLKDKKKAEQIKQMIGKVTTLEAAATALKDSIITADSVRITGSSKIVDAKVLGAIFNTANKGKVIPEPIPGRDAVYVVRVDDLTTTSVNADIASQQAQMRQRSKSMQSFYSSPVSVLRKTATIKDNRRNFY